MDRVGAASLVVGVGGALATLLGFEPGAHVIEAGPLGVDPYFALLGAFLFLIVWGLWTALADAPDGDGG